VKSVVEQYRIAVVDDPDDSALTVIGFGVRDYNRDHAGDNAYKPLCLFVFDPDNAVVGGLIGSTYWNWLYIDLLWVREDLRGHGHGRRLLELAETEAFQRGARSAYLDTFSFQAPDFYMQAGYEVFGELHDFPEGHQRYFFRKQLEGEAHSGDSSD
jgi:GNAT superfamily N-acetyltransferase